MLEVWQLPPEVDHVWTGDTMLQKAIMGHP